MAVQLSRIVVDNFQSIKHADLQVGKLTVLVGPGRSGKSAVIRAIQSALLNATGEDFIRFGEKKCSVSLTFDDGTEITWTKERGTSATYSLKGKEFTKTGQQVPEEIAAYLGIGEIDVEQNFSLVPQLKDQFAPVFVLGESGSRQARILGKLTKLDAVVTAQMECRKQGDHLRREAARCEGEIERLRTERAALPDIAKLSKQLDEAKEHLDLVDQITRTGEKLNYLLEERGQQQKILDINLTPLKKDLSTINGLLDTAGKIQVVVSTLRAAQNYALSTEDEVEGEEQEWKEAQEAYDEACKNAKVCATCPLR